MALAPTPQSPEKGSYTYERKDATPTPGRRGPLRFEEGVATDTDVPDDFIRGMTEPMTPAPGRSNHVNPAMQYKKPEETMQERAHVGSAAWIEAPTFLAEFAHGSFNDYAEVTYEEVNRSGGRYERLAPTVVDD